MTQQAKSDVEESLDAIEDFEQQLENLKAQWEDQVEEISDRWAEKLEKIEEVALTPRRADVTVEFCGLAWAPVWRVALDNGQQIELPARET
jgi:archaellum component FlaC